VIALKKKPKATKGSDQCTISLIAYVVEIVASIQKEKRIEKESEDVLGEDNIEFRR
jgi:hypothetical protein